MRRHAFLAVLTLLANGQVVKPNQNTAANSQAGLSTRSGDFQQTFQSRNLDAMHEGSLFELSKNEKVESYRFSWSRTFHHPVCVRVDINPDGTGLLTTKVTSGKGGYEPGHLIKNQKRRLRAEEVEWFKNTVKEAGIWSLPSFEDAEETIGPNGKKQEIITVDGADWTIEAVKGGKYHLVSRVSPDHGPVKTLGISMLIDLAHLKLLYEEVY